MSEGVDITVERILQAHLLTGPRPGQCSCGYGSDDKPFPVRELGRPHARHVVKELRSAGVLQELPRGSCGATEETQHG